MPASDITSRQYWDAVSSDAVQRPDRGPRKARCPYISGSGLGLWEWASEATAHESTFKSAEAPVTSRVKSSGMS